MKKVYRLYTENLNREQLEAIAGRYVEGFTTIEGKGIWRGNRENSLVVEVADADHSTILDLAEAIRQYNNQESVLVTWHDADSILVVGKRGAA